MVKDLNLFFTIDTKTYEKDLSLTNKIQFMPFVGILRQHPDNSYLLIAYSRENNILKAVDFYHETESLLTLKKGFRKVLISEDTKALKVGEKYLFTGEEPFLFFEITKERYKRIFETAQIIARKAVEEHQKKSLKFEYKASMEEKETEFQQVLPFYEKDEAENAAEEVGYDGRLVNAKPTILAGTLDLENGKYREST